MVILTPDYNNQLLWASEYNPSNAYIDMVILTSDEDMTALPPPPPPGQTSIHGLWSFQLMSTPIWVHPCALWKLLKFKVARPSIFFPSLNLLYLNKLIFIVKSIITHVLHIDCIIFWAGNVTWQWRHNSFALNRISALIGIFFGYAVTYTLGACVLLCEVSLKFIRGILRYLGISTKRI